MASRPGTPSQVVVLPEIPSLLTRWSLSLLWELCPGEDLLWPHLRWLVGIDVDLCRVRNLVGSRTRSDAPEAALAGVALPVILAVLTVALPWVASPGLRCLA